LRVVKNIATVFGNIVTRPN